MKDADVYRMALDRAAYALFQLKRFADMPQAAIDFVRAEHEKACEVLNEDVVSIQAQRPEAVPPALQMALGNHSIGVFDAAGKLLAADADVYAAPESKPERADTAELVYRLQAYTTSFGSDTEGLSLLPEAWNMLRADIEEACRVLAVPSPRVPLGCSTYTRGGRDDHCLRCGEPASSHEPQHDESLSTKEK